MPNAVTAIGAGNDTNRIFADEKLDWLSDPQRLANWQDKLVDSCHAINSQLSEIQNALGGYASESNNPCGLRVISAVPR